MTGALLSFLGSYWWLYLIGVAILAAVGAAIFFLPGVLAMPLGREAIGAAVMIAIGCFVYSHIVRTSYDKGYAAAIAAQQAATDAAIKKIQDKADYWQAYADGLIKKYQAAQQEFADAKASLEKILASQASVDCLSPEIIDELNKVKGMRPPK